MCRSGGGRARAAGRSGGRAGGEGKHDELAGPWYLLFSEGDVAHPKQSTEPNKRQDLLGIPADFMAFLLELWEKGQGGVRAPRHDPPGDSNHVQIWGDTEFRASMFLAMSRATWPETTPVQ